MAIDEKLNILLKDLTKSSRNSLSKQTVITINHAVKDQTMKTSISTFSIPPVKEPEEKLPIVSLYFGDKYAQFHNEFTQTAYNISELKPLIDYLEQNNWEMNLD